jgi:predicted MFS family arabinose efflux permease
MSSTHSRDANPPQFQNRAGFLLALFLTGFGTFLNVYATQPLLPRFRELFHASELRVSLTVTAPVLAIALIAPLIGLLADAIGRKRVIVTAMLGVALPTVLAATSVTLNQLIFWRFLQGLFIPGIIAVAMAYISEESPRHAVGSTMSVYVTGTVVGGFAGRFLAGWIVSRWEWHAAFLVLGAASFAGGLITWALLPASTRFVRQSDVAASLRSMRGHLRNPQLLATYFVGFNVLFSLVGAFTYVNFYLADKPFWLGPAALASIFGVYLIGAVVTPVAGRLLDRIGTRRGLVRAAGLAACGSLLTLIPSLPVVVTGLALAASGAFTCQSAASSHVGKAAKSARSSAAGLYVAFYYLGGCAGSILPGFFWKQAGWAGCVGIIVAMQALTACVAYHFWKEEPGEPRACKAG